MMDEGYKQQKPRFCSACGAPTYEGQLFCQNCGHKLELPQQTWYQPQQEEPVQPTWQYGDSSQAGYYGHEGQPWQQEQQQPWQQGQEWKQGQPYDFAQGDPQQYYNGEPQGMADQNMMYQYQPNMNQMPPKIPMDPKKKKKMIILFSSIGAGVLALIIAFIISFNYFSFTRIDATKLYKITYEGVNGKGRAVIRLDENSEEFVKTTDKFYEKGDLQGVFLMSTIDFYANPNDKLSNGDTLEITVDYDVEDFRDYKIKLTNTEFKVTVEGLQDANAYDLFKDIRVVFDGVDGYGTAEIDTSNVDDFATSYVRYSFKGDLTGLKNGVTVTVVAEVSEKDLNDNGYTTEIFEKEYTVEGLKELESYDVFRDIKLTYEGVSPYLIVRIDTSGCEQVIKDNVYFYLDDNYEKKNGDTVIVHAEFSADYLRTLGYDIVENSKTYTIENQGEVISEINAEQAKKIDQEITGLIESWTMSNGDGYIYETNIASTFGEGYVLKEAKNELVNRYFATRPDSDPYNTYSVINKCTYQVENADKSDTQNKTLYILVTMINVAKTTDETITYVSPETYLYSEDINELIDVLNDTGYSFEEVKLN